MVICKLSAMKKIAVTGANGFIGSRLCNLLKENEYDVVCLVRRGSDISLLGEDAEIRYVDYNEPVSLNEALADREILIHAAALTKARKWEDFQKTNIDLVEQLVRLTNAIESFEQFIFLSSQAAAGPAISAFGKKESEPCQPVTMYGRSKRVAEIILEDKCAHSWTIIRPVSVFGPGEKDFLEYYKILNTGIAPLVGMTDKYLNFIYVDDLCSLIEKSIDNPAAVNECFFAAGAEIISMAGFAYIIAEALNKKIFELRIPQPILYIAAFINELIALKNKSIPALNREKFREMRQRYWLADTQKANELLGWQPSSTLAKQMQTTIKWYKERNLLK